MDWGTRLRAAVGRLIGGPAIRSEADSAAALVANQVIATFLNNPIVNAWLRGNMQTTVGDGYSPLDQNFRAYTDGVTGKFAILSACDDAIGNASASVPLELIRVQRGSEDEEVVEDHPLLDLMRNPNPEQGQAQFWYSMAQQYGRTGQIYLSAVGTPTLLPFANPEELWVLDSGRMTPKVDKSQIRRGKAENPVVGYVYASDNTQPVDFALEQILHIKRPHLSDPLVGLAYTKELEASLSILWHAMQWLDRYYRRGAVPGRTFIKNAPAPSLPDATRFAMDLNVQVDRMRDGDNQILYGPWSVHEGGNDPTAAAVLEVIAAMEAHILAVRGVPPFQIGSLEHANWSNSVEQQQMFYQRAVIPFLRIVTDAMNSHDLVEVWQAEGERLFFRHNYSKIEALQPNKNEQSTRAVATYKGGITTKDESRAEINLPPADDGSGAEFFEAPDPIGQIADQIRQQSKDARAEFLALRLEAVQLASNDRESARATRWTATERRVRPFEAGTARLMRQMFEAMEEEVLDELSMRSRTELADPDVSPSWASRLFNPKTYADEWGPRLGVIMEASLKAGAEDLGEEAAGHFLPFDTGKPGVQNFIDTRTAQQITTIAENRLSEVADIVKEAARDGRTVVELASAIREHFDRNEVAWSQRIARTETLALYNHGGLLGLQEAGAHTKQWLSSRDGRVRQTHRDADGQEVPVDQDFIVGGFTGPAPGQIDDPAESINCFPAGTMVQGRIVAGLRSWYEGDMLEIRTRSGAKLAVTPNHPIATPRGFVPANQINDVSHVLRYESVVGVQARVTRNVSVEPPALEHQESNGPAPIEQIFDAVRARGSHTSRKVARGDLHGDALLCKGDIDVVCLDDVLSRGREADAPKGRDHLSLMPSDMSFQEVASESPAASLGQGRALSTPSGPRAAKLFDDDGSVALAELPLQHLRFGVAADLDAALFEPAGQSGPADRAFLDDLTHRHPGLVLLDQVVQVRRYQFVGHVYDLQSAGGWIVADQILTSNCRCTLTVGEGL